MCVVFQAWRRAPKPLHSRPGRRKPRRSRPPDWSDDRSRRRKIGWRCRCVGPRSHQSIVSRLAKDNRRDGRCHRQNAAGQRTGPGVTTAQAVSIITGRTRCIIMIACGGCHDHRCPVPDGSRIKLVMSIGRRAGDEERDEQRESADQAPCPIFAPPAHCPAYPPSPRIASPATLQLRPRYALDPSQTRFLYDFRPSPMLAPKLPATVCLASAGSAL